MVLSLSPHLSSYPLLIHVLRYLAPTPVRCEVCKMPHDRVKSLGCGVFIDWLTKSVTSTVKDANKVKCEGCNAQEDATTHCVDCGQNFGATCVTYHQNLRATSNHQLIPLHDALKGKMEVKRIPRCKKHHIMEINTYCKTCQEAICPQCAVADHRKHDILPLEEMSAELQDEIVGFTITMNRNEEDAKNAIKTLDTTLRQIEKKQGEVESEMEKIFVSLKAGLDLRHAQLLGDADNAKKMAIKEKEEAEYAAAEFAGFSSFTEGLLVQGTPLEIAGSHKQASSRLHLFCYFISSSSLIFPFLPFSRSRPETKP